MSNKNVNEDKFLIEAYMAGDESALERLFDNYRRPIFSYLNGIFDGNTVNADDVFQETWLRIIKGLPKFKEYENFSSWAFRIAHNQAMQNFRKKRVNDKVGMLTGNGELPEIMESKQDSIPDEKLNASFLAEYLNEALARLPTEQREVFLLRREGVSFREIAAIQGCPLNTALSRMRYVVMFLRKELVDML